VRRVPEDFLDGALFDDLAGVHHRDAVARLGHDAEVVSDHQHRHPQVGLQVVYQVEDLRLNGHVQRGRRLVGHEQPRLTG